MYTVAEVKPFLPDRNSVLLRKNLQSGMALGTRGMSLRYKFELQGASFFSVILTVPYILSLNGIVLVYM